MVEMMSLDVAKINCGNEFTVILTKNGDLYSWGRNEKAQLGVGGERANERKWLQPPTTKLTHPFISFGSLGEGGMSIDMYAMEEMPMAIEGQVSERALRTSREMATDGYIHY